ETESREAAAFGEPGLETRPKVDEQVFRRGHHRAVGECLDGMVDVLVVEDAHDLGLEEAVEEGEVDGEAGHRVDLASHGHLERVVVAVAVRVVARTEDTAVLLVAPLGAMVAVRGAEADGTGKVGEWHAWKLAGH